MLRSPLQLEHRNGQNGRWQALDLAQLEIYWNLHEMPPSQQAEYIAKLTNGDRLNLQPFDFRMHVGNVVCPCCERWVQYTTHYDEDKDRYVCKECRLKQLRGKVLRHNKRSEG